MSPHIRPPVSQKRAVIVGGAAFAAVGALLFLMMLVNWPGFRGGGSDDWQYLDAARCVREQLFCLPETHWAARYMVVYPLAATTALFGEGRFGVGLPALLAALTVLAVLFLTARRYLGVTAAVIGCAALVLTPAFVERTARPNADMAELAWIALSVGVLTLAGDRGHRWVALSGLCAGLALGTRATAFVPIAIIAAGWVIAAPRSGDIVTRLGIWALAAILPPLAEMAVYAAHGDALLRWVRELNHTAVPSTALDADHRGSFPMFNPALIAAWPLRHGPDIHWSVNGLLGLFFTPTVAATLVMALASMVLARMAPRRTEHVSTWVAALPAAAAIHFAVLVYGLGVDPTPRMFLPGIALLCVALGANIAVLQSRGKVAATLLALLLFVGVSVQHNTLDLRALDQAATRMIGAHAALATNVTTSRMLALNRAAANVPVSQSRAVPHLLVAPEGCTARAKRLSSSGGPAIVLENAPLNSPAPSVLVWLRSKQMLRTPVAPELCIIQP